MGNDLNRTIARFVFYFVALVLLAWTATLTYSFVAAALPQMPWYVPLLSLVVFDLGMVAWLFVYLNFAEGSGQRAVALLTALFDLAGIGLMVLAEILLGGQSWATAPAQIGEYAIWGIALWTVANVAAVVGFHLLSPEARKQMALQAEKDAVFEAALHQLKGKRERSSAALADRISDGMLREMVVGLLADQEGDGMPDVLQLPSLAAAVHEEGTAAPAEPVYRRRSPAGATRGNGVGKPEGK